MCGNDVRSYLCPLEFNDRMMCLMAMNARAISWLVLGNLVRCDKLIRFYDFAIVTFSEPILAVIDFPVIHSPEHPPNLYKVTQLCSLITCFALFLAEKHAKHASALARITKSTTNSCRMSGSAWASKSIPKPHRSSRRNSATCGRRRASSRQVKSSDTSISCLRKKCLKSDRQGRSSATSSSLISCHVRI